MSSMTFPTTSGRSLSPSTQEEFFGSSYNPSSSFQVNPLSHHPPRTPRTSIISTVNSNAYANALYASVSEAEEAQEKQSVVEFEEEEVADDVEEDLHRAAVKKVKSPEVWREILKTSTGRDKAFVRYIQNTPFCVLIFVYLSPT